MTAKPTTPKKRRIVIAEGNAQVLGVPFDDLDYEIWGLNALQPVITRWDRWFELHNDWREQERMGRETYLEWLHRDHGRPIYMIAPCSEIPNSVAYPLREIQWTYPHAYFCNSLAYMIALAIHEQVDEIYLYGMNETDRARTERAWRNIEFWLGIAVGRGIGVWVHPASELLRSYHGDERNVLYGYSIPSYHPRHVLDGFLRWKVDRSADRAERRGLMRGLFWGAGAGVAAAGAAAAITWGVIRWL